MYSDLAVVLNARLMLLRVAPYEPHLSLLHVGLCSREGEQAHSTERAQGGSVDVTSHPVRLQAASKPSRLL